MYLEIEWEEVRLDILTGNYVDRAQNYNGSFVLLRLFMKLRNIGSSSSDCTTRYYRELASLFRTQLRF